MPKYINLKSGFVFSNKKSIPLCNQQVLGIQSLTKYNQEKGKKNLARVINKTQREQFVIKNKKTNKILTMKDIMDMGSKTIGIRKFKFYKEQS